MGRRSGWRPSKSGAHAIEGEASPFELEQILGHEFHRPELLMLAMTHRSFVYDQVMAQRVAVDAGAAAEPYAANHPSQDNEQLEFMGDAALGLLAAESLCKRFPGLREGELTRLRASVVSRQHLGAVGTRLNLGRWLRLGHTAEKNDGRQNAALFANAMEALIAALYLDGGIDAARRFVEDEVFRDALPTEEPTLADSADAVRFSANIGDHKTALQEMLQAEGYPTPRYRLLAEIGPAHRRVFRVAVVLARPGQPLEEAPVLAEAEGTTKKRAQQEAARLAVDRLTSGALDQQLEQERLRQEQDQQRQRQEQDQQRQRQDQERLRQDQGGQRHG